MAKSSIEIIKHNVNNPNFDLHAHVASIIHNCDLKDVTYVRRESAKEFSMVIHQFVENIQGGQDED